MGTPEPPAFSRFSVVMPEQRSGSERLIAKTPPRVVAKIKK
jgi:hypothetical protein